MFSQDALMQRGIHQKTLGRVGVWLSGAAVFGLLGGVAFLMFRPLQKLPFAQDPRFIITTSPQIKASPSAGLLERGFIGWLQIQQRVLGRHPGTYSFPASPRTGCSIHGLLNQCTEVSGVRYVIPKDVAAGSVQFGHTNVLTGPQWVRAFSEALQQDQPQWWDSQAKRFVSENLVFVTNDARTLLVLPKSMVQEFQPRVAN